MKNLRPFERDRYLGMLFRQVPGAIWATDRNLLLTYVAGRFADNMSPRATPGMSLYDIVAKRDPGSHGTQWIAYHLAAIAGESQSVEQEFNGRWYQCFIEQLRDESGNVLGSIASAFDVTEQRATQERLAKSEALLAQAQRVAHIGSFEWDLSTNAVTWSDELHRIYGIEPGQFKGTYEGFLERVHPDDLEKTKSSLFDGLRTGLLLYEHRVVRSDGDVRVIHTRGEVVSNENGRAVRIAGSCWDVTELRETMDNLKRARSLLEAVIEATADGILVVDRNCKVTVYNQRFVSLWRIPEELIEKKDHEKLLAFTQYQLEAPEEFLLHTRDLYNHPEKEGFDVLHFKDGRVFERHFRPQRLGTEIVGRVWSVRDVTERERLLKQALFLSDATRLLGSLDIEPALQSVAQLAVPLMGEGCAIDLLGQGGTHRIVFFSGEGGGSFSPELHGGVLAGHPTIYSMGARSFMAVPLVVKDTVGGAITLMGRSMSHYENSDLEFAETLASRTALSVENAQLYRTAQQALRARDEFLTIAAHEIRGPITSLHMAIQGLKGGKAPASALPRLIEIIEREDRRLARFVNELLDLGNIQNGQMQFKIEEVDFGSVVRDAATKLSAELSRSGSTLSIKTEGRPIGFWDSYGLSQVAENVLSNAIKFGEGHPIDVIVRENQGRTTLTVKDGGLGMPPELLDRIFKPFQRGVSVSNYGGLGLGLFIAHTIVEGLGGTIHVESQPGKGSVFTIELANSRAMPS